MASRGYTIFIFLVLTLLSACGQKPESTRPDPALQDQLWLEHQRQLSTLDNWQVNGRIGLRTDEEGWSATLIWQQQGTDFSIRLIAPLGQGTYQIQQQGDQFRLLTPDNESYEAATAEALMLQQLGWSLPVHALRYWVIGLMAPGLTIDNQVLDNRGRLKELQQAGWTIHYRSYHDQMAPSLPQKLSLKNDRARASVLAKQWTLSE